MISVGIGVDRAAEEARQVWVSVREVVGAQRVLAVMTTGSEGVEARLWRLRKGT